MSLYIKFLDIEYDGIEGKFLDVMELQCFQHGLIKSWSYDYHLPYEELEEEADEHMHSMHFA